MEQLPLYIPVIFGLTVMLAGWLFAKATPERKTFSVILAGWIAFQSVVALTGFYTVNTVPPRLLLHTLAFEPDKNHAAAVYTDAQRS